MTVEEMKQRKKEKGYSVAKLSELSGVPVGTIQKILSGETANPRYDTSRALERVLGADCVRENIAYAVEQEKRQGEYTVDDYRALPDERRVELIDGVIYDMNAPTFVHQRIAGVIHNQIMNYIKDRKGDCIPLFSPVDVQLDCDEKTMVQPDVIIICDHNKIKSWGIMGAPEFVLEVISPSTKGKDFILKLNKYKNAGVKEYWIVDPYQKRLTVYAFETERWPETFELKGVIGVALYENELKINLDEVAELIQDWPE